MTPSLTLPVRHCSVCGQPLAMVEDERGRTIPVEADESGRPIPQTPRLGLGRVQLHRVVQPLAEDLGRTTVEVYPLRVAQRPDEAVEVWKDHRVVCG